MASWRIQRYGVGSNAAAFKNSMQCTRIHPQLFNQKKLKTRSKKTKHISGKMPLLTAEVKLSNFLRDTRGFKGFWPRRLSTYQWQQSTLSDCLQTASSLRNKLTRARHTTGSVDSFHQIHLAVADLNIKICTEKFIRKFTVNHFSGYAAATAFNLLRRASRTGSSAALPVALSAPAALSPARLTNAEHSEV